MNILPLLGVILLLQQLPPTAGIQGVVLRAGTTEPVAGARVMVLRTSRPAIAPPAASSGPEPPIEATTDGQGTFAIKDLEVGNYSLMVYAHEYVRYVNSLNTGPTIKDLRIFLTPAGNVTGRIRDTRGKPLAGIPVQLLKPVYNFLGQRTFQAAGSARTNDRGEYRLYWITPGRYYVLAGSATTTSPRLGLSAGSPNEVPGQSVLPTYYPNAADPAQASTIDVQSGGELSAVDFELERQQPRRIRGRVIDRAGQSPASATIFLVTRTANGGTSRRGGPQNLAAAGGAFEVRDVPPGNHEVVVEVTAPGVPAPPPVAPIIPGVGGVIFTDASGRRQLVTATGRAPVSVGNSDVDGVVVTVGSGVEVSGQLRLDGQTGATVTTLDRLNVQLTPISGGAIGTDIQAPQPSRANIDGSFAIQNVLPGEYRIGVAPLAPGFYIKEARIGQNDLLSEPLNVSASFSGSLEVVIRANAGQLDGTVVGEDLQPLAGIQAVLIPDEHRERVDLYKTALSDQNGRFHMQGIVPGNYRIFAWQSIDQFRWFDPDVVKRYEQKGQPVLVREASRETVQAKIIPDE
jgi:hypothetical protein